MRLDIYEGVVLDRDDPKSRGRYYVYIPEVQFNDKTEKPPVDSKFSGIWCYNLLNNFVRYTEKDINKSSDKSSFGNYFPLKPGTHVLIGISVDEGREYWNLGYILNVISFEQPPNKDRDNFYLLEKTDKNSWMYIDEKNSDFALSFHAGKSNVWGKEDQIQISKDSGTVVDLKDDSVTVFHDSGNYLYIDSSEVTMKNGSSFIKISSDHISIRSNEIYIQGASSVAIEGGAVEINDGVSVPDTAASKSDIAKPSLDAVKTVNDTDKNLFKELSNGQA